MVLTRSFTIGLTIGRPLIAPGAPSRAAGLLVTLSLTQLGHHPAGILIQPFTGPHSVKSKRCQHRSGFLGGSRPDCCKQISSETTDDPVEPLTQIQLWVKAAAIELVDQRLKALLSQHAPAGLHRQRIPPALNLLLSHTCRRLPARITTRIPLRAMPPLAVQAIEFLMQPSHLSAQGIVFPQQSLHVAGDTFTMLRPIPIITR